MALADSIPQLAIRMFATERDRNAAYLLKDDVDGMKSDRFGSAKAALLDCEWDVSSRNCLLPKMHNSGVLVLAHSFHPDWVARDEEGKLLKVVPADYAFLGIIVPEHAKSVTLEFSRKPLWISIAVGIMVLMASLVLLRWKR